MTDTAREPIAHLWQHKETGRVYYQGPHDEAPQSTYALIGPLFLEPSAIPPREPTEDQRDAARYRWLRDEGDETWRALGRRWPRQDAAKLDAAIDAAIAERGRR